MKTPIRYAGGKSKAYKLITSFIPTDTKKIVSPFVGGGSLEVKWATENNIKVEGYDIFDILVNYWKYQLKEPAVLYKILKNIKPSKEDYKIIKEKLLSSEEVQKFFESLESRYYDRDVVPISKEELAAYYFYNHNLSYGPMFLGWYSSVYNNIKRYTASIERVRDFKAPNLHIDTASFDDVIENSNDDFLYLDPPYYLQKDIDNKMCKGMYPNCNYAVHHNNFAHERLRDLLHSYKGRFVMSYNNCATIREWYKDFRLEYPSWQYSYANGEKRKGKNKINNISDESKKQADHYKNLSDLWVDHDIEKSKHFLMEHDKIWHTKESHEILIIKD